jgi:hypothetical protein
MEMRAGWLLPLLFHYSAYSIIHIRIYSNSSAVNITRFASGSSASVGFRFNRRYSTP